MQNIKNEEYVTCPRCGKDENGEPVKKNSK